jgi:hypothetical protein
VFLCVCVCARDTRGTRWWMNSEEESVRIFCFPSPRCVVVVFRVLVHPLVLESTKYALVQSKFE